MVTAIRCGCSASILFPPRRKWGEAPKLKFCSWAIRTDAESNWAPKRNCDSDLNARGIHTYIYSTFTALPQSHDFTSPSFKVTYLKTSFQDHTYIGSSPRDDGRIPEDTPVHCHCISTAIRGCFPLRTYGGAMSSHCQAALQFAYLNGLHRVVSRAKCSIVCNNVAFGLETNAVRARIRSLFGKSRNSKEKGQGGSYRSLRIRTQNANVIEVLFYGMYFA
ncbi:hypothetical protein C8R45DRAFT_1076304 [Mycena sanguinolenta]|nr:hypothetical protein C8R45DRAFT_1076304 [Mycena sanguinolenta]